MEIMSVIAALLGMAGQQSAINQQTNLGYANLYETKRQNREQKKLATSSREDAYGNQITYDPVLGWQINTTPMTQNILDAEQNETLLSLTEDAARNRNAAVRRDDRSQMADEEFEQAFNNYKYRPQKSKEAYVSDALSEATYARRKAADNTAANVNKTLIRTGNSSAIPSVFREARDAEAEEFEGALLSARRRGEQDYLNSRNAEDGMAQQELGFLAGLADGTTALPQRFTNTNAELAGREDQALATLLQTLRGNQGAQSQAMSKLIDIAGQSVDFAPLASALGKLGGSFAGSASVAEDPANSKYAPIPLPRGYGDRVRAMAGF